MRAARTVPLASLPASLCSARLLCVWALANVHSPGRDAIDRVLNLNSIIRQSGAGVALRGQRLEGRSRAQVLLLLHDGEGLLGEISGLARGLHTGAALLQRVFRVPHLDTDLLLELLLAKFRLAILQLRAVLIGLGDTIANRNIEVQSDKVIRGRAVVRVFEGTPEIGRQRGGVVCGVTRIQLARQSR